MRTPTICRSDFVRRSKRYGISRTACIQSEATLSRTAGRRLRRRLQLPDPQSAFVTTPTGATEVGVEG